MTIHMDKTSSLQLSKCLLFLRLFRMGRKGGGKKAFLKGVVAKPDADEAALEHISTSAPASSQNEAQHAAASQAAGPEPTAREALPGTDHLSEQQLDAETLGQLTQRQKKVIVHDTLSSLYAAVLMPIHACSGALQEAKTMKEIVKRLGKKRKVREFCATYPAGHLQTQYLMPMLGLQQGEASRHLAC